MVIRAGAAFGFLARRCCVARSLLCSVIGVPRVFAIALFIPMIALPARAADVMCPNGDLTELIDSLLVWIGDNSDYDVEPSRLAPPSVESCSVGDTIELSGLELHVESDLLAAYGPKQRVIYLVTPWNARDLMDQSRLLHELVHDIQSRTRTWACPREQEWDAYKLQDAWLRQNGIDPRFNWARILVLSRCHPKVHE